MVVAVSDTGAGMLPEVRARAFEPFYTTKGVGHGTGLGLNQIYGYLKQSGGHAQIYSEVGHGTTVKLYLPRQNQPVRAAGTARPSDASALARGRAEEVVLVVEDEPGVRAVAVEALTDLGCTVRQAEDGPSALAVMEQHGAVALLFTDVVMPGMTGRELADQVAQRWPEVRILYTTGYTANAIVHGGRLDAGVSLLPKPYAVDELGRKVRAVLDATAAGAGDGGTTSGVGQ